VEELPVQNSGATADVRPVRVAVIGAGVSGLAAAKCLLEEGVEPVVFEQSAEIGGVWNFHEDEPGGGGPAYRSLHTNTSRQTTAFSDFPFPSSLPDFPARAQVLAYLNDYARRFGLLNSIRLRTEVEAVTPTEHLAGDSNGAQGNWQVMYRAEGSSEANSEMFDGVLVCSGLYRSPASPTYPGSDSYQGEILHSRSYKGPEGFEGKEVVVVGTGSSGADIAVELSNVARRTTISAKRGAWLLPRFIGGKPYDHRLTRLATQVPYQLRMRLFERLLFGEYRRMGISDPRAALGAALPAERLDVLTRRLTPGSELIRRIASGAIEARPWVSSIEEQHVVFSDGTRTRADIIIMATGYNMGFPFLQGTLANPPANILDLYKLVFHPELPGLAFIGMCTVAGPVIPVIEMQARWAARVLARRVALPAPSLMRKEVRLRRTHMQSIGSNPMRVQLLEYMDDLAKEIGAKPNLVRRPALTWRLLTGAPVPSQYRLEGPGWWKDAEQAVKEANRRPPTRENASRKRHH
jgi:dimethylaniline monooxygenase (N-oxide forming)